MGRVLETYEITVNIADFLPFVVVFVSATIADDYSRFQSAGDLLLAQSRSPQYSLSHGRQPMMHDSIC